MEAASIINHVSLGTDNLDAALAFYDAVLPTVGARRLFEHPGAVAYGKQFPEFWVQTPHNGEAATVGNGVHICFHATSREMVEDFYRASLAAGGQSDGEPGPRSAYGPAYYGCFVIDPDGHKLEANFWDESRT